MSRWDRLGADDIRSVVAPDFGGPRFAVAAYATGRTPQQKHRAFDSAACGKILGVHLQIDTGCCAIILANGMDGRRVSEATFVFGKGALIEEAQALFGFRQLLFDKPIGIGAHHPLRQVVGLYVEEPMPGERCPLLY